MKYNVITKKIKRDEVTELNITKLRMNHLINPIGFWMDEVLISYVVENSKGINQKAARIVVGTDMDFTNVVYDSGMDETIDGIGFKVPMELTSHTKYYWYVSVQSDLGEEAVSEVAFFETAKALDEEWVGYFITQTFEQKTHPVFRKVIHIEKEVKLARFYGVGVGIYELYLNKDKVGDEYLLPGIHDYDSWLQYQTFELELNQGDNLIEAMLGDGWYKGPYGLKLALPRYGDEYGFIGEIYIEYKDGTKDIIGTDTTWNVKKGKVQFDSIYDGEIIDERFEDNQEYETKRAAIDTKRLVPRLSPKILINEKIKPISIIKTPLGETVLDMGQNMVGWIEFKVNEPKDTALKLYYGEILQEGNFYRDNLRNAKCEFTYITDGTSKIVRPHFTYYGFRYVKLEGFTNEINLEDFTGCVIYSQMEETGKIVTSNPLVNQLFSNVLWGQKGNFLDTPTDCPQRDERMGWTGDAQIFADTACFNMDTYAFYVKFMKDLAYEQEKDNGSVPYVVPKSKYDLGGASTWGDAATVIPWICYIHYGDKAILGKQYESMKAWVDYIKREDDKHGSKRLWMSGRHFGDWLALDGKVDGGVYGSTDKYYIASAYYYYSANIVAKAAKVLGNTADQAVYEQLADEIKSAFLEEYYTRSGRLSIDTQTGYAIAIQFGLVPEGQQERIASDFKAKMKENAFKLNTGFVGTPYLCLALSESGHDNVAYDLLLNEEYPGWLYEVNMGATTIWERWNSVLPDGSISGTGMNSLNHYAYGSIASWMYRYVVGIQPMEEYPGFKRVRIAPKPDYRLDFVNAELNTIAGLYKIQWSLKDNQVFIKVNIPFNAQAEVILPRAAGVEIKESGKREQIGSDLKVLLSAGEYTYCYTPNKPYKKTYGLDSNFNDLMKNEKAYKIIAEYFPRAIRGIAFQGEGTLLEEIALSPFGELTDETMEIIQKELEKI